MQNVRLQAWVLDQGVPYKGLDLGAHRLGGGDDLAVDTPVEGLFPHLGPCQRQDLLARVGNLDHSMFQRPQGLDRVHARRRIRGVQHFRLLLALIFGDAHCVDHLRLDSARQRRSCAPWRA